MREKRGGSTGTAGPSGPTWPLRWARVGFGLVLAAAALSVLAGTTVAAGWLKPGTVAETAADERCESPPCLPESLPDPASLPIALPLVLIALAVVLGAPTLLVGLLTPFRGGRRLFSTGLLVVVGPLLVLVGTEIVPHVVNPCLVGEISTICASTDPDPQVVAGWSACEVGKVPVPQG